MTTFLDSNVVIDVQRGSAVVRGAFYEAQARSEAFSISVLVLEELMMGVHRSASPERQQANLLRFLSNVAVIPFEEPDAQVAAEARAKMWRAGLKPSYADLLIGAHTVSRGGVLVTANTKHFQNIPGLQLLDWTQPETQDAPHA